MILVTVGTASWNFERLVKEMDNIAGTINEKVVIQLGDNEYIPKNADYFRFVNKSKMEELYENSRLIVSHAGVGSIISAFKHEKSLIVVPRRKEYKELFDDHQIEIAEKLEDDGVIIIEDIKKLKFFIGLSSESYRINKKENSLILNLKEYLNELE